MDLAKLAKKLRNELLRNPKKSAILGVICLVALYFWAPLLRSWVSGGKSKKPAQVAAATPAAVAPTPEAPTPETSKAAARAEAAFRWDKLLKQREQDPLTLPGRLANDVRNPFRASEEMLKALAAQEEVEKAVEKVRPVEKPVIEQTPQALGFALKGTVVGPNGRFAQINRRTFAEGAIIAFRDKEEKGFRFQEHLPDGIEFTLASVQRDRVVLKRGDTSYTLEFPRGQLTDGDSIVRDQAPAETP